MKELALSASQRSMVMIVVLFTTLISGFAIDIYTPSLPAVTQYFGTSQASVQLTITTYIIGYGLAQLYAGSISDSFGRRSPIVIALLGFIVISFLIPFAQDIYQLQVLRFLQGVAVGFVNVPTRAIVADLYEGSAFFNVMNYITIAWSIGPIIAPMLGGYLQHYIGWYASFYFLGGYATFLFILNLLIIPETIKIKRRFNHRDLGKAYIKLLSDAEFSLALICMGLLYSLVVLFGVVAPFLIQSVLGYSAIDFGHMSLAVGFAWFAGNMTNRFLANVNMNAKIKFCLYTMLFVSFVMLFHAWRDSITIGDIIVPTGALFFFGSIVFPNYFAYSISLHREEAGYANGLLGGLILFITGITSVLAVYLESTTQMPLTLAYMGIVIFCLVSFHIMRRMKR